MDKDMTEKLMSEPMFHIALINPEIRKYRKHWPFEFGVGARLHLVKPLSFDISKELYVEQARLLERCRPASS